MYWSGMSTDLPPLREYGFKEEFWRGRREKERW
jgi:hypothetical protein